VSTFSHADPRPTGTPTPLSVEARIAVIRSLIGHRRPSRHLLHLIALACAGASWDEIASADAEARR
jgi:hypothetical protein